MADPNDQAQERTESATPRRREEARREGRVARSSELSAAVGLLAGAIVLSAIGGTALADFARRLFRESARSLSGSPLTPLGAVTVMREAGLGLVLAMMPFAAGVMGSVVLVNAAQTRGLVSWKAIEPKWSHLDVIAGLKRLVGMDAWFALVKSVLKLAVLGVITWLLIARSWSELVSLADMGPSGVALVMRSVLVRLAVTSGIGFLLLSGLDYAFQWFRLEKSLRMSRQEIVREHRETEGDPLVKARMQSIARSRARQRMLQRVPTADVVVVNPTHIAVALRYDVAVAPAPVVVAMGRRKLAERIKAIALKAGVPVLENRPVARALIATAVVGKPIPPALYAAIAEILAFVYRMRAPRRLDEIVASERGTP